MEEFEASWPEGFYDKLSKKVVTFAAKTKHLVVNDKIVIDPEAVYARAIGLAVSNREINFLDIMKRELTPYPPAYFTDKGVMREMKSKATLKHIVGVEIKPRHWGVPTAKKDCAKC